MSVAELLKQFGPMTTGGASRLLQERGLSAQAARQAISRRPDGVGTLHGLPFPKRARFIYLESQFGSDLYWSKLTAAIEEANPAYAAALSGVRARGGIVLRKHFDIASGSPILQKRQLASSVVLERLRSAKLLSTTAIEGFGDCVILGQSGGVGPGNLKLLRAQLLTENVLLEAIRSWAVRMNMTSKNVTRIRDDATPPQVGTFRFDMTGPCYLRPLLRFVKGEPNPGFLVGDVILGNELDEQMVRPFIRKCTMLGKLNAIAPILPMLIADNFTPEALRVCRRNGIVATRPETLFGRDVARALEDLLKTLTDASMAANEGPSRIESLFRRLNAIEGAAGNLRGALFELIVGHCVRSIEGGTVDIGTLVNDFESEKRAEIDVKLTKEKQITAYECKGYQPSSRVGGPEVKRWLQEKVPTIYAGLKSRNQSSNSSFRFEFWTCGDFDADAIAELEAAKANTRRYQIDWKNGRMVQQYVSDLAAPGIRKILDEHYFAHPIAVFQRAQPTALGIGTRSRTLGQRGPVPAVDSQTGTLVND